MIKDVYQTIIR